MIDSGLHSCGQRLWASQRVRALSPRSADLDNGSRYVFQLQTNLPYTAYILHYVLFIYIYKFSPSFRLWRFTTSSLPFSSSLSPFSSSSFLPLRCFLFIVFFLHFYRVYPHAQCAVSFIHVMTYQRDIYFRATYMRNIHIFTSVLVFEILF